MWCYKPVFGKSLSIPTPTVEKDINQNQKKKRNSLPRYPFNIGRKYRIESKIDHGAFATVYRAFSIDQNVPVAIKGIEHHRQIDIDYESDISTKYNCSRLKEAFILKHELPCHPNIIQVHDIVISPKHIYIVTEYAAHGTLYDFLEKRNEYKKPHLQPIEIANIFVQIVRAIEHCHRHRIAHRDIKLENIVLVDPNAQCVKLIDFGFAINILTDSKDITKRCGSPHYAGPEFFTEDGIVDPRKSDMWSLGVLLFVLSLNYMPYDSDNPDELANLVHYGKYRPILPNIVEEPICTWITGLLQHNPNQRTNIVNLLNMVELFIKCCTKRNS